MGNRGARAASGRPNNARKWSLRVASLGASVNEVAQRHGVRAALLGAWRRKAASLAMPKSAAISFAAVQVSAAVNEGIIEIDLSSRCVRVRGIVDGTMLSEVLAAAR